MTTGIDDKYRGIVGIAQHYLLSFVQMCPNDSPDLNSYFVCVVSCSRNKSRAIAGKPCEAVYISICKASRKLHTEDTYSDRKRKLAFSTTALSFDSTSPAINPDEYRHKTYIARNHRPWKRKEEENGILEVTIYSFMQLLHLFYYD